MKHRVDVRNHSRFNGSQISAARIQSMMILMEPEDIAAELGQPWPKLKAILDKCGVQVRTLWAARNDRTGEVITSNTERGCYAKAQLKGWVDWDYIDPKAVAEVQP